MSRKFDNSLRMYNKQVLRRSRMHLYTKKYIEELMQKAIFDTPQVNLTQLSDEYITQMTKGRKWKPTTANESETNENEQTGETSDKPDLKIILSKKVNSNKYTSKFKTEDNDKKKNKIKAKKINENSKKDIGNKDNKKNNKDTIIIKNSDSSDNSKTTASTSSSKIGKIHCRDINTLLEAFNVKKYTKSLSALYLFQTKILPLSKIEYLYHKYFKKSVPNTIAIVANILYTMTVSNRHYISRMAEVDKKKIESEKHNDRCVAGKTYSRHKTVLEYELKNYVLRVISEFECSEFEAAFNMFFFCILTLFRVIDQPGVKNFNIFEHLSILMNQSFKNTNLDHVKVLEMLRLNNFHSDCIDVIHVIQGNLDNDLGTLNRMSLFFKPDVKSKHYFQKVFDAVKTETSDQHLISILNHAAFLFSNKHTTRARKVSQKNENCSVLSKTPNRAFQPYDKSKKSTSAVTQPSNSTQPYFYGNVSNNLVRESTAAVVPYALVPLVPSLTTIGTPPTIFNGPAQNVNSYVTFQHPITNMSVVSNNYFPRPGANTVLIDNTQYCVVSSPMNQIRPVTPQGGIVVVSPKPVIREIVYKCDLNSCQNIARIMCCECRSVRYCSHNCQRLDWYDTHLKNCQRLKNMKET